MESAILITVGILAVSLFFLYFLYPVEGYLIYLYFFFPIQHSTFFRHKGKISMAIRVISGVNILGLISVFLLIVFL